MGDFLDWLEQIGGPIIGLLKERLGEASEGQIADLFAGIIAFWFLLALGGYLLRWICQRAQWIEGFPGVTHFTALMMRFTAITPGGLTILGVLGTFTGIFIGLLDFDPNPDKINDSIPLLLNGMRIAFVTSIVGMAAGLTFRVINSAFASSETEDASVAPEDIHQTLVQIRDDNRAQAESQAKLLDTISKAISGEADSSLNSQIMKLRTDIKDGQNELLKAFREFAEHMVENTHKALIESLEKVIREFNEQLTEQFGKNFQELNKAVGRLLEWQENYRKHVDDMQAKLEAANDSIESTKDAVTAIREHAAAIPEAMQSLAPILEGIQEQIKALSPLLESIAALRDKASEAFPAIEGNLEQLTSGLKASVEAVTQQSADAVAEGRKAQEELSGAASTILADTREAQEGFSSEIKKAMSEMSDQAASQIAEHSELLQRLSAEARDMINESLQQAQGTIEAQMRTLDEETQKRFEAHGELIQRAANNASEMVNGALQKVQETIDAQMKTLDEETRKQFTAHGEVVQQTANHASTMANDALKKTLESVNSQMKTLDEEMQKELQRAVVIMGQNLAALSEKFVEDYKAWSTGLENAEIGKRDK